MKQISTILLKIATVALGLGVLAFLLWEPHVEGVNAHSTLFEIYFRDPFLAYVYIASLPSFVALWQAYKAFSHPTVKALRTIRYCMVTIIGFVVLGEIFIALGESDDRAGGVFMGLLAIAVTGLIAAIAERFERKHLTA
ncbi:MAG TPA: DUF2975 domain-containing protein [Candidatus Paceibacterota bacterium]|jgi:Protein of unknown function (DUF3036).